jgi:Cu/Ag efflux pump CusA
VSLGVARREHLAHPAAQRLARERVNDNPHSIPLGNGRQIALRHCCFKSQAVLILHLEQGLTRRGKFTTFDFLFRNDTVERSFYDRVTELTKDVILTFKGEVDSMRAAIQGFAGTLPLAMVLIYLVMVGLFRSWLDPFVVMFAVPLGFIGVIWMLLVTHTSVNVESLIGTLMMIGIVVSNSVLLVDFANNRLREGLPLEEAVVEAGKLRIRPILMTSLATVIGLAPMALGIGEGSESNMPLARAVIGGLLVSTFMTLLFIPVLHVIARRRSAATLAGPQKVH